MFPGSDLYGPRCLATPLLRNAGTQNIIIITHAIGVALAPLGYTPAMALTTLYLVIALMVGVMRILCISIPCVFILTL